MTFEFSAAEREALKEHGLAVFEDRLILEAQDPVDEATLNKIAQRLSGPIPDGLLRLWRCSFGGRLDCDLTCEIGGQITSASFNELFYPESGGYRDLWGWIEHEAEIAEEAAEERGETWSGRLDYLPFGGFEYCDRVYVKVAPGPDHGAVILWMQGLPAAWKLRLHEDSLARIADDVPSLFRSLVLEQDARVVPAHEFPSGLDTLEALDALKKTGDEGRRLAGKLETLLFSALVDWRAKVEDGSIARDRNAQRLALEDAAAKDDLDLVKHLQQLGCDLTAPLRGGGTLLDHAMVVGSHRVVAFALDLGMTDSTARRTR